MTSLSEANGAPEPGVTSQPPKPATLRIIDPTVSTSQVTLSNGHVVTVQNLSVDAPAGASPGGGLGSTLTISLPSGLAPGASVNVAFTFAVDTGGTYWFGYDVDALTAATPGANEVRTPRVPTQTASKIKGPSPEAGGRGRLG
jgi:hypothetical protein